MFKRKRLFLWLICLYKVLCRKYGHHWLVIPELPSLATIWWKWVSKNGSLYPCDWKKIQADQRQFIQAASTKLKKDLSVWHCLSRISSISFFSWLDIQLPWTLNKTPKKNHSEAFLYGRFVYTLQVPSRGQTKKDFPHNLLPSPRWWFQIFVIFTPTWGRFPIWRAYFSNGLKPPTSRVLPPSVSLNKAGFFFGTQRKIRGGKRRGLDFFFFSQGRGGRWVFWWSVVRFPVVRASLIIPKWHRVWYAAVLSGFPSLKVGWSLSRIVDPTAGKFWIFGDRSARKSTSIYI